MEDIAQSANVSAATAYNHFPTKHALLGQVYAPIVHPLVVQARHDIANQRPVIDALTDQVRALCRLSARNRALTSAFWAAAVEYTIKVGGPPDPTDDNDPRTLAPIPDSLKILIEHGQRTGQLRRYPPAIEISGLLINILLGRAVNRPHEDQDTTAELLLTVMFGALCPELVNRAERPFCVAG